MNLPKKLTSWREALPVLLRCLAIALAATLVGALAVGAPWLMHRPVGYSGNARVSSTLSPDFASGFDVAWEVTASDLGVSGSLLTYVKVDGFIVALFGEKGQPSTLVGLDLSGEKPSVLWRREVSAVDSPMFAWEDSIVVAGQTIRVADGEVTATWDTPLPADATSRFVQGDDEAFINVGGDYVDPGYTGFSRVTWPIIVVCYPRDKPYGVQDFDYLCLGWNKDGTEAWRYEVSLSSEDLQGPGLPLPVTAVDGYVPVSRNFNYEDRQAGAFLHLADGTLVESATYNARGLHPVADGWLLEGGTNDPRQRLLVTLAPDGTEVSRTLLADPLIHVSDVGSATCWDEEGRVARPTSEQATSTLTSGEFPWASVCVQRNQNSTKGFSMLNGHRLMATNGAGGAENGTYPESLIAATDGSLILSQPPEDKDSTDKNPPMNLYTAPSGIQLASLEDVGLHDAVPFYDDLLIASPTRSDSWLTRLRSFLGFYPHPETVLMGITPKRAG
ncbi:MULTISPECIES: hypothetical protein [Actinomycetaceae]|uniref:hypothetical protein n=1 Tax=Actinomycetaceae TaxID=2049 RepID=UPI00039804B5|nr:MULTISPECIES: hypothetical protein [Actinomycetaceae]ERH23980.1 hypothetical protein HMPREF1980_01982 [Actinomyces sp. oral taxon 172 str. F0311]WLD78251.1 hypothetical protein QU663_01095 [Schaalia sp. HMT-172]